VAPREIDLTATSTIHRAGCEALKRPGSPHVAEKGFVRRRFCIPGTDSLTKSAQKSVNLSAAPQVIPEGEGPVEANGRVVLVRFVSFLVLAGRVELGVGGKARAGARPRRGRRALTATAFGACCSGPGRSKKSCATFGLFWWIVVVFGAGFPGAGQAKRGCRSFLRHVRVA
jgi:hypothetical protein